jgi:hypothetical protein
MSEVLYFNTHNRKLSMSVNLSDEPLISTIHIANKVVELIRFRVLDTRTKQSRLDQVYRQFQTPSFKKKQNKKHLHQNNDPMSKL